MACVDLEIGLHRRSADSYEIEMRTSLPESDAEVRLLRGGLALARFDFQELLALGADATAYGQALCEGLFADEGMRSAFAQVRSVAAREQVPLRLRLFVGPTVPELHNLRWETLRDPDDGSPLFTGERVLFSRYLSSQDWHPVGLQPRTTLRSLLVIASPANVADYQPGGRPLAPLDVEGEAERARTALKGIPCDVLASGGHATLQGMTDCLQKGYDLLYLVCHGALAGGEPRLWLEDDTGHADVVSGSDLVTRLREMQRRPRLVVLASCQSAGQGDAARSNDEGVLTALGPRLAEAGVPAVLAMQGNVTTQTVGQFMPVFFRELQQDGRIDRAMAVARGAVQEWSDWWVPVLFMRLRSGRLWYTPGFGKTRELEKWPALIRNIKRGRCTPILGPGLTDSLIGSRREIARRWAETYSFPLAIHDRDDLPQVAQYLAVHQDEMFPRDELGEYLKQEILRRYRDVLPDNLRGMDPDDLGDIPLDGLISAAGAWRRQQDAVEPHRVLAQLPLPVYITTNPGTLLPDALVAEGKEPRVELCCWNEYVERSPSIYDDEPDYRPTVQRPLVYHLYGRIQDPDSLVLTEDDYFDFLIGVTRNRDLIPPRVSRALTDSALLFLGFHMNDWNFRVLFRSIISREGGGRRDRYAHVAVQIDPEEGRILEPARARRYLESYFQDADISIYWGTVEGFVQELHEHREGGEP
jgi:hypothetical protein